MDEFGVPLPMGDLRQGLVAQSRHRRIWRDLFNYRFSAGAGRSGLTGHSLGNLILHALEDLNHGDLLEALFDAEELLNTVGHVLPVSLAQTTLRAELDDGTVLDGEHVIDQPQSEARAPIRRVWLDPVPQVTPQARKALERSTHILLGPGDLYTSILPNLLVDGVCDAIRGSDAEVAFIVNLMTKHGETDGYSASDFVRALTRYLGRAPDAVVVHTEPHPLERLALYADERAAPVPADADGLRRLCGRVLTGDFAMDNPFIRHDADKVLAALWPAE